MEGVTLIVLAVIVVFVLMVVGGSFFTVNTAERAVVERFNKFDRVAEPGLAFKLPFIETTRKLDMRVQQVAIPIETKTKDNVFVKIPVAVQYQVLPNKVFEAYYKLAAPQRQIEAYVYNVILGHVPKMDLDTAYESQQDIALAVKKELDATMETFGYLIVKALVTDIIPAEKVKSAMNDINAARREQEAALAKGEAARIMAVKNAEAEAQSKKLQGEGIANQRKAIIDGLRESVETFTQAVPGSRAEDVMMLVVMTQYLDTLKEIGASSRSNTILIPHTPGALADLYSQIRSAVLIGNETGKLTPPGK
ncbi:MAG TPA: SPFH domain-containing protein [Candidatus Binatia bacterium]|nr:SPFH domain-containing protein [Candidatus Binatia bacterium]